MRIITGRLKVAIAPLAVTIVLAVPSFATAGVGGSSTSPAGAKLFGVNESNSWHTSPARATPAQLTAQLSDLHAEAQRWQLDWQAVEPNAPAGGVHTRYWTTFDSMYDADIAAGIRPLIIVTNAPKWAWPANAPTGPGSPGWGFPPGSQHLDDWSAFVGAVARHYPQAAGIEVWNEPNHPAYWGRSYSSNYPDPVYYSQLLHSAYDAVKAVDPGMPVIGGALSNWQVTGGGRVSALDFAKAMFAAGAAGYMDAISIHPYPQSFATLNYTLFTLGINQMRTARDSVGASTPIWVTEFGVSTSGSDAISESAQADALADAFRWIETQPDIEAFFVHTLTEPDQDSASSEKGFALMHGAAAPFTAKPAYTALRQAATPAPEPPPPPPVIPPPAPVPSLADPIPPAPSTAPLTESPSPAPQPPPMPAALAMALRAASPQAFGRTRRIVVRARCNQECSLRAHGSIALRRHGHAAGRYRLVAASGRGYPARPLTLILRLPAGRLRSLRSRLRHGFKALAKVRVDGAAAGGKATSRVRVRGAGPHRRGAGQRP
jgi:hypothetical protein